MSEAIDATRAWLERAVIGLNLCPFAKAVHVGGRIRWFETGLWTNSGPQPSLKSRAGRTF